MSRLRPGDEEMHYSDGSHRWTPHDSRWSQHEWEERIREHQQQHQRQLRPSAAAPGQAGAPGQVGAAGRPPAIPRQRSPLPARYAGRVGQR